MAVSYSSSSIENLKNQINIVDEIGRVVPLKRTGSSFKGLCPFHSEKTPSFSVSESRQYFTCFGCGASGDVIEFVKRYYNLDFPEAVEKLAEENGIPLERRNSYDDSRRRRYYEVNGMAARFFYRAFTGQANPGYAYMKRRGISPRTLKKFGIGYADGDWHSLQTYLKQNGVDEKTMLDLGLISGSKGKLYDRFRNRVMFPIINTSGKVIGFGGRAIRDEAGPKYLNSPESPLFHKKDNLYGLNFARQAAGKEGFLILVEGYMDAVSLYQSGIQNVSASLGTALTEQQARLIHRYTEDVVLSYDADSAGRKAALRGIEILRQEGCKVRVLHVTDGKDPDEYVKKYGKEAFLKLIEGALSYADYKLDACRQGLNLNTEEGEAEFIRRALDVISALDPVEAELYKKKLAESSGISRSVLDREMETEQRRKAGNRGGFPPEQRKDRKGQKQLSLTPVERTLLKICLEDQRFFPRLEKYDGILQSPLARRIAEAARENAEERDGPSTESGILDRLTPEEFSAAERYFKNVPLGEEREEIFQSCINDWKIRKIKIQERDLRNQLSLAEEAGRQEDTDRIMRDLDEIQKKKRALKR